MNIDIAKIQKQLAKEMQGKLFAHISVSPGTSVDAMMCTKSYYTVLDGKVYRILKDKLDKEDDDLITIMRECREIGLYEKGKAYEMVHQTYIFEELAERLKL